MKRAQIQLDEEVYDLLRHRAFQGEEIDCRSDTGDRKKRYFPI